MFVLLFTITVTNMFGGFIDTLNTVLINQYQNNECSASYWQKIEIEIAWETFDLGDEVRSRRQVIILGIFQISK